MMRFELDLHGQYVEYALKKVKQRIRFLAAAVSANPYQSMSFSFIVGKGIHSAGGRSPLRAAVQELLMGMQRRAWPPPRRRRVLQQARRSSCPDPAARKQRRLTHAFRRGMLQFGDLRDNPGVISVVVNKACPTLHYLLRLQPCPAVAFRIPEAGICSAPRAYGGHSFTAPKSVPPCDSFEAPFLLLPSWTGLTCLQHLLLLRSARSAMRRHTTP